MTIEEIFEQHPTTCCYEEDARYVYPEREKLLIAEIARLEAELAEWRNSRDGWILSVETAEAMAVTANAELVAYKEVEDSLQKEIKRLDGELAEARKEKVCECDDYEKEMKHIDSFFVLGYVHGMKFTGKQFAYCPYCGGRIE